MADHNWKNHVKENPLPWILSSNPWTRYRTLVDLMEMPENHAEVTDARKALLTDERIRSLIREADRWFPEICTRHNSPELSHYRLRMLSDFGLTAEDEGIKAIALKARDHMQDGLFALRQELPEKGKGFYGPDPESDDWHALPCDSPLISSVLISLGCRTPEVFRSAELIRDKWTDSRGWFCHFFFVESMYRKLQAGCPMAGLQALELFSLIPELRESEYARNAFEPIRFHREYGKSIYYFGRSRKFWTLKYPFIWYNALYLAEVLTRFEFLKEDVLLEELVEWIEQSQDEKGRFRPTSMFMAYRDWDFSNKKEASPWITFLCCRILKNYYSDRK